MNPELVFTENDALIMMHKHLRTVLNELALYLEKNKYDNANTVRLLREIADEADAERLLVSLRDVI